MVKLVDTQDSGSCAERCGGSSPLERTSNKKKRFREETLFGLKEKPALFNAGRHFFRIQIGFFEFDIGFCFKFFDISQQSFLLFLSG